MADVTPIRVIVDAGGDTTGLSEFLSGETLGLVHGGTGATTAAGARSSLGLHAIAVSGSWTDLLNKPTTDGITEGSTNLYYTDARVLSYLGTNSYVTQSYVDNAVSNILDGAPGVLDTLNELAAAIGDDANFITTINSSISTVQSNVDALFGTKTTTDLSEGTNLYFTNERVDDRVANLITDGVGITKSYDDVGNLLNIAIDFSEFDSDDIVEGAVNTFLNNKSTDDLSEGSTNLYFTNERVDDRVDSLIVGGTNISTTYSDLNNRLTFDLDTTGGITLTNNSTSDLPEGTNLYYTNARADARVTAGISSNGIALESFVLSITNPISANLTSEITRATDAEAILTTNISNEIVRATTRENTLLSDLEDEIFDRETAVTTLTNTVTNLFSTKSTTNLAEGSNLYFTDERVDDRVNALFVDGNGIIKTYDDAGNLLTFAIDFSEFDTDDIVEGSVNTFLNTRSTDDLTEGSSNLYYTDARVRSNITGSTLDMGSNDITTTGKMLYENMYATEADLPSATTYHGMFAHVHATGKGYFAHSGAWKKLIDESSSTTTDLTEGTNLYYLDSRARLAVSASGNINYNSTTGVFSFTQGDTDTIAEGASNLYYTDARVQTKLGDVSGDIIPDTDETYDLGSSTHKFNDLFLSGSSITLGSIVLKDNSGVFETIPVGGGTTEIFATESHVATAISNLVDVAPAALDTLNELAAALNDDDDFAGTMTTALGTKLNSTDFNTTADTWISGKSTTDLSEGTNLYYTDARADTRIALQAGANLDLSSKSTTDLSEGTNLYYTDARVRTHITGADLDMGSNDITTTGKMLFANMYATTGDLPSATTYHGMFAHVHGTGKGYFAHGGNWVELANHSQIIAQDFSWTSITGTPTTVAGYGITDAFDGVFASLTSVPTTIAGYGITDAASITALNSETSRASNAEASIRSDLDDESFDREQGDLALQSNIDALTSDDIALGSTNLYYTDTLARGAISGTGSLNYDSATGIMSFTMPAQDTDAIAEGSNLYYTDARVQTKLGDVSGDIIPDTDVTYDLGSTTHRFKDLYLSGSTIDLGGSILETSGGDFQIPAGSKLPSSPAHDDNTHTLATTLYVTRAITNLVDGAPAALDTLNELAAAIADDENYATTITTALGTKLNTADFTSTANTWIGTKGVEDLGNVNLTVAPTTNQTLIWDVTNSEFVAGDSFSQADFNTAFGAKNLTDLNGIADGPAGAVFTTDGAGNFTFEAGAGSAAVFTGATPPTGATVTAGTLWYSTEDGSFYIYYEDVDSSQWVQIVNPFGTPGLFELDGITDTSNGHVLYTDGSGNVSFQALPFIPLSLTALTDFPSTEAANQVLTTDGANGYSFVNIQSVNIDWSVYALLTDLPSATTNDGMVAKVTETGRIYHSHNNTWNAVANSSDLFSENYNDLTNLPTLPTTILDLGITDGTSEQILSTDGSGGLSFVDRIGAKVDVSAVPPSGVNIQGDFWYSTDDGSLYVYYVDTDSSQWVQIVNPFGVPGLDELDDVTLSSPLDLQLLQYNVGTSKWNNSYITIQQMSDVMSTQNPSNNDFLRWNAGTSQWEFDTVEYNDLSVKPTLQEISDVKSSPAPSDNDFLRWNAGTSQWEFETVSYADLSVKPNLNQLTDVLSGSDPNDNDILFWNDSNNQWQYKALTIQNLADVDYSGTPNNNQVLTWNTSANFWEPQDRIGASVETGVNAPAGPNLNGDIWWNSEDSSFYIYYTDTDSSQWVQVINPVPSGFTGKIIDSPDYDDTTSITNGQVLAYNSTTLKFEPTDAGSGGGSSSVTVSDTAPSTPSDGDMWFNSLNTQLYIRYNDGSSTQWVQAIAAGTGSSPWTEKSTAYTVVAGEKLFVDCSAATVTVTLPSTAALGDEIRIIDATGNSSTNNITIARNGHNIQGDAADLTIDTDRAAFGLVYYNVTQGWLLSEK